MTKYRQNLLSTSLFTMYLFHFVEPALRTWIGGEDALVERSRSDCSGLLLPISYRSVIFLKQNVVSKIVLPQTGGIALERGAILTFDENEHSCKEFELKKTNLNSPENWNPLDNRAIPDLDRMPCQWDSILIPNSNIVGIQALTYRVRSVKIFNRNITDPTDNLLGLFSTKLKTEGTCTRETCPCQSDISVDGIVCASLATKTLSGGLLNVEEVFPDETNCDDTMLTMRSCHRKCGTVIEFEGINNTVDVNRIKNIIQSHENRDYVDFFYGLGFQYDLKEVGQFIIVDKTQSTGGSYTLEITKKLEELLKDDRHISIYSSGQPIIIGSFATSGPGLFLITLALVLFLFLGIYIAFMTPIRQFDIRNMRINTATFRPFVFARFDNSGEVSDGDEERRRVDIAFTQRGKMTSKLESADSPMETTERAFDNPLYGQPAKSVTLHSPEAHSSGDEEVTHPISSLGEVTTKGKSKDKKEKMANFEPLLSMYDDEEESFEEDEDLTQLYPKEGCKKQENNKDDLRSVKGETSKGSSDEETIESKDRPINSKEMLKFIKDNLQQVNLLDEQL